MRDSILDTVGSPLVKLADSPADATVAAKLEFYNPSMSGKAQPAMYMVEHAERDGHLTDGDTIVEPTSGNTGIALAMIGAVKGYDVTLVLPASASEERKCIMRAYGATIDEVSGGLDEACERANELEEQGAVQLRQFENEANPQSHYDITGDDILTQVGDQSIDAVVAGIGTGGTITGIGRRLKDHDETTQVIGIQPMENRFITDKPCGSDEYPGMGPSFLPDTLDTDLLDDVETIPLEDAHKETRRLAQEEGILAGPSSGASALGAKRVAQRLVDDGVEDPLVITVFWDSGERYLSTGIFDPEHGC